MRRAGTSTEDLKAAARMIRADEEANVIGRAPAIEYVDIAKLQAEVNAGGAELRSEAEATAEKIQADEDELKRRVLPSEEGEPEEEPQPSLIERLPEHIAEPPKAEEIVPTVAERLAPAVAAVKRGLNLARAEFDKTIEAGREADKIYYDALGNPRPVQMSDLVYTFKSKKPTKLSDIGVEQF
jgi:hypothetical protein